MDYLVKNEIDKILLRNFLNISFWPYNSLCLRRGC